MTKHMEEHVIGEALLLISKEYDFNTIAQKLVTEMEDNFGDSWIC